MQITLTTEEQTIAQWGAEQRNVANPNSPSWTAEEWIINCVNAELSSTQKAMEAYQLQQLVPLGEKYNVAPDNVKLQVDALLAPYNP